MDFTSLCQLFSAGADIRLVNLGVNRQYRNTVKMRGKMESICGILKDFGWGFLLLIIIIIAIVGRILWKIDDWENR